jgi:DNA-directed RNA polymerase subunit RPC12/RpoP
MTMNDNMISYTCPYCGTVNNVDIDIVWDEYVECSNCDGLVDVEMDDSGNIIVEEF